MMSAVVLRAKKVMKKRGRWNQQTLGGKFLERILSPKSDRPASCQLWGRWIGTNHILELENQVKLIAKNTKCHSGYSTLFKSSRRENLIWLGKPMKNPYLGILWWGWIRTSDFLARDLEEGLTQISSNQGRHLFFPSGPFLTGVWIYWMTLPHFQFDHQVANKPCFFGICMILIYICLTVTESWTIFKMKSVGVQGQCFLSGSFTLP